MNCPSCGTELPAGEGQHAVVPAAGVVDCPNCGARVNIETGQLEKGVSIAGGAEDQGVVPDTEGEPDSFAGETTVQGVMAEIEEKEQS